jgi:hypothetical protein
LDVKTLEGFHDGRIKLTIAVAQSSINPSLGFELLIPDFPLGAQDKECL